MAPSIAKPGKQTRLLPGRGGLNDLAKTDMSLLDYSKASPLDAPEPNPATILNLAQQGPK
jgi:hypothetical protein